MFKLITFRSDWAFWPLADRSEFARRLAAALADWRPADRASAARRSARERAGRPACHADAGQTSTSACCATSASTAARSGTPAGMAARRRGGVSDLRADLTRWI